MRNVYDEKSTTKRFLLSWILQRTLISACILFAILSLPVSAQNSEAQVSACSIRDSSDRPPVELPPNMRLILQKPDVRALQLVDPRSGTVTPLANTEDAEHLLLTNNGRGMLIIRSSGGYRIWYFMNVDGSQAFRVRASRLDLVWLEMRLDDTVSFTEHFAYSGVLSLENGAVIERMDLPDELPDQIRYPNATLDRMDERTAYWASSENALFLRILTIDTGDMVDIRDVGGQSWIWWSSRNQFLGVLPHDFSVDQDVLKIYDANDGVLVHESYPPAIFPYQVGDYLAWSPGDDLVAVDYKSMIGSDVFTSTDQEPHNLHIFDLRNNSWLENCFQVELDFGIGYLGSDWVHPFYWTPDGRFLWWMEETEDGSGIYDLIVADVETGAFSTLATNVGLVSAIGIVN